MYILTLLGGCKYKIYSCHILNFVFTLTQWIQNLQYDKTINKLLVWKAVAVTGDFNQIGRKNDSLHFDPF